MRKFVWPVLLVLAACAVPPREPPPSVPPGPAEPRPAPPSGPAESWQVVASHLEVRVYRDGPMQKLGHNHLITSDALVGEIALRQPLDQSRFELALPLESLVVDDPAARAAAGGEFAAPVPEKDREATRRNMLGEKLLDAASQGDMHLSTDSLVAGPGGYEARLRVALGGQEHVVAAPFTVSIEGDRLEARAAFKLTHAALGLQPFNVALGSLKVRDDFDVQLTLEARRGT
jgi:hypothetical protein